MKLKNFLKRNYYRALDLLWWLCIVQLARMSSDGIPFKRSDIHSTIDRNIFPLLQNGILSRKLFLLSCLDVGCGMNPVDEWFYDYAGSSKASYHAIDVHPEVKQVLSAKGINVMNPAEVPDNFQADLVLAQEVIEHIHPQQVDAFVMQLKKWTGKVMALTCPDFSGLDTVKKISIDRDIRYVPDHLKNFYPESKDPYMHKFAVTPELLLPILQRAFPEPEWSVSVYQAWPWLLTDIPSGKSKLVYSKIYAVAWKN